HNNSFGARQPGANVYLPYYPGEKSYTNYVILGSKLYKLQEIVFPDHTVPLLRMKDGQIERKANIKNESTLT
ncbi:hypothetical protein CHS0354_018685, partial [Potamilus streckersoni]